MKHLWLIGIFAVILFAAPAFAADSYTIENTGFLSVQSNPSSADVYVSGIYYGKTPITIPDLEGGKYTVKVIRAGYFEFIQENVNVNTGKGAAVASVTAELWKDNANGGLIVYATPAGASVYIDDVYVGKIPQGNNMPLEVTQISPGAHTITVSAAGYETVTKSNYEITAANTETLRVTLHEEQVLPAAPETAGNTAVQTAAAASPAATKGSVPMIGILTGLLSGAVLLYRRA